MSKNRLAEHLVAGALAVLMLLWLWQATRLPYTVAERPGPGFFPVWLSAIGLVLSIAVLIAGFRPARRPSQADAEPAGAERDDPEPAGPGGRRAGIVRLVGALLGAVAFLVLMPVFGFVVGLALFLAYLCLGVMRMRVASSLALSLGTAAAIYLVFGELLAVPFPTGMVGI